MAELINLVGKRFGRLIVVSKVNIKSKNTIWECLCDCGLTTQVQGCSLRFGKTKSCGCLLSQVASQTGALRAKHGHKRKGQISPTYMTWQNMNQRCNDTNHPRYNDYGGRGITICERWKSFENFLEDMGERIGTLTLERLNNDKGYYKDNCIWATPTIQASNRRPRTRSHKRQYSNRRYVTNEELKQLLAR